MKNAPNLKNLPKDKFTEAIIFAGADAWVHAKAWQENNPAHDTVPPVIMLSHGLMFCCLPLN